MISIITLTIYAIAYIVNAKAFQELIMHVGPQTAIISPHNENPDYTLATFLYQVKPEHLKVITH